MATERQIEANRLNATRSTGPKTDEGKARSRLNATTHGLACEAPEVEAELAGDVFRRRRDAWAAEYRPAGEAEAWSLERAVAASFRVERVEEAIEADGERTGLRAELAWDQDRADEAATLAGRLKKDPMTVARKLQTTKHGVLLLVDWWTRLLATLRAGGEWSEDEAGTALDLLGVPIPLRSGPSPIDDPAGGPSAAFREAMAAGEVARLTTLLDGLGRLDELDRQHALEGAADLIAPRAKLLLRYEREAWRRYRESIKELAPRAIEPRPEPAATPKPVAQPARRTATPRPEPMPTEAEIAALMRACGLKDFPADLGLGLDFDLDALDGANPIFPGMGGGGSVAGRPRAASVVPVRG